MGADGVNEISKHLRSRRGVYLTVLAPKNGVISRAGNALQLKYQRQLNHGLQALASYTWSHAIDWASADNARTAAFPLQRGNSDNDVRNNFTAALVYNLPTNYENRFVKAVLGYWNADLWFVARSAFPYEPVGPAVIDPVTGYQISGELNYDGKHPYVYKAGIPGGRQIDPTIRTCSSAPSPLK